MSTKRRGHGEGSITHRSDGRWEARLTLKSGKRKCLYAATRTEVQAKLKAAIREQEAGVDLAIKRPTLAVFLDQWLADVIKPHRAPKTYTSYADMIRVHIVPTLGHIRLDKLTAQDVAHLLASKLRDGRSRPSGHGPIGTTRRAQPTKSDHRTQSGSGSHQSQSHSGSDQCQSESDPGLSPHTVRYIRTVLHIALKRAQKWGYIVSNPVDGTEAPTVRRPEIRPLTPEQARTLLAAAEGDRLDALYRVALALGLRIGEALGLTWADVDFATSTLRVRRSLQRIDGKLSFKDPKTAKSLRTLTMPSMLVTALRQHRIRQLEERLIAGEAWHEQDLIFTNTIGRPLEPSNVLKRFKALLRDAGLPQQRFHDLRHCAASLLIAQGVHVKVVADILGHAQLATTSDLYAHIFPAAHRDAADLMDAILSG